MSDCHIGILYNTSGSIIAHRLQFCRHFLCNVSGWLANKVIPFPRSRLRDGIPTFPKSTSCHSWRLEDTERSCWRRFGC